MSRGKITLANYAQSGIIEFMNNQQKKSLIWVGAAKKDLKALPDEVQGAFSYALYQEQLGKQPKKAKVLKGFGSAGVLEVVENDSGGTYRAVYTVRFTDAVYVLHCFQKKSTHGIATPKPDMRLIEERLKMAQMLAKGETK